jgi:hypothetical protein
MDIDLLNDIDNSQQILQAIEDSLDKILYKILIREYYLVRYSASN